MNIIFGRAIILLGALFYASTMSFGQTKLITKDTDKDSSTIYYKVRNHETAYSIAKSYGVTTAEINNLLEGRPFQAGVILKIRIPKTKNKAIDNHPHLTSTVSSTKVQFLTSESNYYQILSRCRTYTNASVSDLKRAWIETSDDKGNPTIVVGEFTLQRTINGPFQLETIKLLIDSGLMYGITFSSWPYLVIRPSKSLLTNILNDNYGDEIYAIRRLAAEYLYRKILAYQKRSYTISDLDLSKLELTEVEQGVIYTRTTSDVVMAQTGYNTQELVTVKKPVDYTVNVKVPGLKNPTNHNIYILGYASQRPSGANGLILFDATVIIKPGQSIPYSYVKNLRNEFDSAAFMYDNDESIFVGKLPPNLKLNPDFDR